MLNYDLQLKLANLLAENGLDYNFLAEDIFLYSKPYAYEKYVSYALEFITGIISDSILNNGYDNSTYDIDLINKIAKCLLDSNDEELKNIVWNSFIAYSNDERFILHKEKKNQTKFTLIKFIVHTILIIQRNLKVRD